VAEGHSPEEARRLAREAFGDRAVIAKEVERLSESRTRRWRAREFVYTIAQDARFGLRGLGRSPGFAVAAVVTLALGIGANALVFGLIEAALMRRPGVRSPETLAMVYTTCRAGDPRCSSSYPDYEDYRDRTRSFADLASSDQRSLTLGDDAGAEAIDAGFVTGNYFRLLGVSAARGRMIEPSDDGAGADVRVAVLSDALWRTRFGEDPGVVGRTVRLNGIPHVVIGVAPRSFTGLRLGAAPDVWVSLHGLPDLFPLAFDPSMFESRARRWMGGLVARLAEGATVERARAELLAVSAQLAREDSASRGPRTVTVDPLPRYVLPIGGERFVVQFVSVLQGVVALTLLLACANLANLLLARGSVRRRELGVRSAIGAGRTRIVRQLLTESMVLGITGGILGLAIASFGLIAIRSFQLPFGFDVAALGAQVNGRVVAFSALLAMGTVAAFGTLPALHASRGDLAAVLRESRTGGGRRANRLLGALVGVQVALCVLLLAGAGLFLRTLSNHLRTDLGFRTEGLALLTVDPSMNQYTPERALALTRDLSARIAALPGVTAASAGMEVPVTGGSYGTFVYVEGYTPAPDEEMRIEYNYVAPGYFNALGLPIVRGREFSDADAVGAQKVVIIDEEFARAWFPNRDPIGGLVRFRDSTYSVVVGVVRRAAWSGVAIGGDPYVLAPILQNPEQMVGEPVTFIARTSPERAARLLPAMRAALRETDPGLAINLLGTMDRQLATALATQRAAAVLLVCFGGLALLLASIGIYGVIAYSVAQRRREFGIRLALGARIPQVFGQVVRSVGVPVVCGALVGLVASAALGQTVRSMMFGVEPGDPLTLGAALAILALAAAAATLIPARRAARTDPMEVMRAE
ncbi:MAG: ADOP family duplicated permease, partial [Longimicrobiales bacterium]